MATPSQIIAMSNVGYRVHSTSVGYYWHKFSGLTLKSVRDAEGEGPLENSTKAWDAAWQHVLGKQLPSPPPVDGVLAAIEKLNDSVAQAISKEPKKAAEEEESKGVMKEFIGIVREALMPVLGRELTDQTLPLSDRPKHIDKAFKVTRGPGQKGWVILHKGVRIDDQVFATRSRAWAHLAAGGVERARLIEKVMEAGYNVQPGVCSAKFAVVGPKGSKFSGHDTLAEAWDYAIKYVLAEPNDDRHRRIEKLKAAGYDLKVNADGTEYTIHSRHGAIYGPFPKPSGAWDYALNHLPVLDKRAQRIEELKAEGYGIQRISGTIPRYYPAHNGKICSKSGYPTEGGAWDFIINCPAADSAFIEREATIQRLKDKGWCVDSIMGTGKYGAFFGASLSGLGLFKTIDKAWDAAIALEDEIDTAEQGAVKVAEPEPEIEWHFSEQIIQEMKACGYSVYGSPDGYRVCVGGNQLAGCLKTENKAWSAAIDHRAANTLPGRGGQIQKLLAAGYHVCRHSIPGKFAVYLNGQLTEHGVFGSDYEAWSSAIKNQPDVKADVALTREQLAAKSILIHYRKETGRWHWENEGLGIESHYSWDSQSKAIKAANHWHREFKVTKRAES